MLAAAGRLLESSARSVSDVRTRLARAGWPAALIEGAIERLLELGLLDDEAFARSFLESRDRAKPRGERALKFELRRKGLAQGVVDGALNHRREAAAVADVDGDGISAEELAAERLLERRARTLDRMTDDRARRQWAYALLARNGFDPDVAGRVAGRVNTGRDGEDHADSV